MIYTWKDARGILRGTGGKGCQETKRIIWISAYSLTILKRWSHNIHSVMLRFLGVTIKGNEQTLMHCIIWKLTHGSLHGSWSDHEKSAVFINVHVRKQEGHTGEKQMEAVSHCVPYRKNKPVLFCQDLYLLSAGSDSKSDKYFSKLCKGYLRHTARPPEDDSSAGYIRYIWGGLCISSCRRMRGSEHCWAITAAPIFCHVVSQQETISRKENGESRPSPT